MSYNWEVHNSTIKYGNPVTRKTVDVTRRVYRVEQLRRDK